MTAPKAPEFCVFTWADFEEAARTLALHFYAKGQITHVVGVPRGGLCLAVKLSHMLNVPMELYPNAVPERSTLIVDDIWDTGATMADYRRFKHRAVWVAKGETDGVACAMTVHRDLWVTFPWENPKQAERERADFVFRRSLPPPGGAA